jgi:transglutaminase-like putative cysteine protease
MKLTVSQQIRIAMPEGAPRAVVHALLTPRSGPSQTVRDWHVAPPTEAGAVSFSDAFGNMAHLIAQARPPQEWVLAVTGTVETHDRNGVLGRLPGDPVPRLCLRQTPLTRPAAAAVDPFRARAAGADRIGLFHALMEGTPAVQRQLARARAAEAAKPPEGGARVQTQQGQSQSQGAVQPQALAATLTAPGSSTRAAAPDLAHTLIGLARELGIPARYVTGYLGKETATAPAMHAWAELFDEGLGWIGFDPLLQLCPTDAHVRVGVALDAHGAAPIRSVPVGAAPPVAKLVLEFAAT